MVSLPGSLAKLARFQRWLRSLVAPRRRPLLANRQGRPVTCESILKIVALEHFNVYTKQVVLEECSLDTSEVHAINIAPSSPYRVD
jgi:hypothetical protein